MDKLKASVLKRIKPGSAEEKRVGAFAARLEAVAKKVSRKEIAFCGSIGKSTWLSGDHDIDMFILFPKSASREELEKNGLLYGKRIAKAMKGRHIIKYAEHPYVQAIIGGFNIDIVPCYKIEKGEGIKSAVDRSPLHLEYILAKLKPELMDEVRLLKQFCKGVGVYGSDTKNLGFSGYICELLILNSRSFENVLTDAAKWKAQHLIDVEHHSGDVNIKDVFSDQPLLMIDPVDPKRNVAANLSSENFVRFVEAAKAFLAKPDMDYFFPPEMKQLNSKENSVLKKRGTRFIAIKFKKPDIIDDVLYPQLRRAIKRIETLLRHNEFIVIRSFEYADTDAILVFELEVWSLPNVKKMVGPPIFSHKHSKEFLSKYKKTFIEGIKWAAERDREFITASQLLNSMIKMKPGEMIKNGIPGHIAKEMTKADLIEEKFFDLVKKNKKFSAFLRKRYFYSLSL